MKNNTPVIHVQIDTAKSVDLHMVEGEETLTASSLVVAQFFGRDHKHVQEAVNNLLQHESPKVAQFASRNFISCTIEDSQGKSQPMYHMTKSGLVKLVSRWSGKQAEELMVDYILQFEEMEKEIARLQAENTALLQAIIHDQKHILDAIKGKDKGYVVDVVRLMERDQGRAAVVRAHETKVEIHEQFVKRAKSLVAQGVKNKELTESLQNLIRWHEKVWDDLFVKDGKFASSRFFHDVTY